MAAPAGVLARAKVNLALHVTGRRPDGYHLLDSLVVFAELGDRLTASPAEGLSLGIEGPFATALASDDDNLVLRAARLLAGAGQGADVRLTKALPVASGIGGGSADAAAALRLLADLWHVPLPDDAGLALGADVPVCLDGRPMRMAGIGEKLTPLPAFPEFALLLVNPMRAVSTPAVFGALDRRDNPGLDPLPHRFDSVATLADYLSAQRNDLQAPARALVPDLDTVLAALAARPDCRLARMSGSGATCFGLFDTVAAAEDAAGILRRAHPGWWIAAAPVAAWAGV